MHVFIAPLRAQFYAGKQSNPKQKARGKGLLEPGTGIVVSKCNPFETSFLGLPYQLAGRVSAI